MSSWIISIAVAVLLGTLVEVVMPEGRLNKIIKSILGVLCMLIIISPLKSVDISKINFNSLFPQSQIDTKFVEDRQSEQISLLESNIESNLETNGYKNVKVKIDGKIETNNSLYIKNIFVDLENLVLNENLENINKYNNIVAIIQSSVEVQKEQVIFYE